MGGKQSKTLNSSVVSAIDPEWVRSACQHVMGQVVDAMR